MLLIWQVMLLSAWSGKILYGGEVAWVVFNLIRNTCLVFHVESYGIFQPGGIFLKKVGCDSRGHANFALATSIVEVWINEDNIYQGEVNKPPRAF